MLSSENVRKDVQGNSFVVKSMVLNNAFANLDSSWIPAAAHASKVPLVLLFGSEPYKVVFQIAAVPFGHGCGL